MSLLKSKTAKVFVGFLALTMVLTFVAVPSKDAQAQSLEELLAMIAQLQNTIANLQGGSTTGGSVSGIPAGYQFTRDLTVGSTGSDVMYLQMFLNSHGNMVASTGAGSPGMESDYFGSLTKMALASYQAAQGISPAVGYFGPISRANVNASLAATPVTPTPGLPAGCLPGMMYSPTTGEACVPGTTPTPGTGELEGGAGDIESVEFISGLNNEEVGEGQEDVEVVGYEIEVTQGSDLEITSLTLDFDKVTTGGDDDFEDYADEVSVWYMGEEVARVDASTFDDDNNYRRSVTLDGSVIIGAGDTENITVALTGVNNLDSTNASKVWNVGLVSMRFRDAQNAIITYNSGTAMDATPDDDTSTGTDERPFTFEDFASASNAELVISVGDDDINDARSIAVDASDDTDGVKLFSFTLEAEGDSDIEVKDLPIVFTAVGADVDHIINSAELFFGDESVATENITDSASSTQWVLFDDIDYTIPAGQEIEVTVEVDVNDLDGTIFVAGDTLMAEIGETQTNWTSFDAEDEQGNNLADADKTGSATSDAHTFYVNGLQVSLVSTDAEAFTVDGSDNDYVNLTIKFSATAFGQDLWIPNIDTYMASGTANANTGNAPSTSQGIGYYLRYSGSSPQSTSTAMVNATVSSSADEGSNAFELNEGVPETFTLKITVTNASSSQLDASSFQGILTGINFATSDTATGANVYTSNLISTFKTDYATVAD